MSSVSEAGTKLTKFLKKKKKKLSANKTNEKNAKQSKRRSIDKNSDVISNESQIDQARNDIEKDAILLQHRRSGVEEVSSSRKQERQKKLLDTSNTGLLSISRETSLAAIAFNEIRQVVKKKNIIYKTNTSLLLSLFDLLRFPLTAWIFNL